MNVGTTVKSGATISSSSPNRTTLTAAATIAAAVVVLAYAPMLLVFFQQQWARPQSQFFPFVIAAFGVMFWMRWREGEERGAGREARGARREERGAEVGGNAGANWAAIGLGGLAWISLMLGVAMYNPWASAVSALLAVGAVCVVVSRRRRVPYLWGLWAMLWLMIPLPLGFDQKLVFQLQLLSSRLSSQVLDVLGVSHLMSGNLLLLPDKQLFVDEACSGIVSVMSIVACAVIYGVWRNRPPLFIVVLAVCGVFWAVIMNTVRICAIAAVHQWWGVDWSAGAPHEILSLVIFLATFGALLSTERLLSGLLAPMETPYALYAGGELTYGGWIARAWDWAIAVGAPEAAEPAEAPTNEQLNEPVRPAPRRVAPAPPPGGSAEPLRGMTKALVSASAAFGLLAAGQFGMMAWAAAHPVTAVPGVKRAVELAENSLPETLGGLKRTKFDTTHRERDDIFGEFSRTYVYSDEEGAAHQVSCDFPFSQGWHELTICYGGAGWRVAKRTTNTTASDTDGGEWTMAEAELERDDGARGYVVWSMFDENGEPVSPPLGAIRDQIWRLLVRRSPYVPTRQMFQVQVFVTDEGEMPEERKEAARRLLGEVRERLRGEIVAD
jgi:exosortase